MPTYNGHTLFVVNDSWEKLKALIKTDDDDGAIYLEKQQICLMSNEILSAIIERECKRSYAFCHPIPKFISFSSAINIIIKELCSL